MNTHRHLLLLIAVCILTLTLAGYSGIFSVAGAAKQAASPRERLLISDDWRFTKGDPPGTAISLHCDAVKPWILPAGNDFVKDHAKRAARPEGNPGAGLQYIAADFDDSSWRKVDLPHDYAIEGPFTDAVSGSVGRLPAPGVVWYRKALALPASGAGKSIFLDIDGTMSYSMVWVNGRFVGGWPYGYTSYRLDLTPYAKPGKNNVLALRLDNPVPKDADWRSASSRWYPGAGIYRNVWPVKTSPVHVAHWGTHITTPEVSEKSARVDLKISVDNDSNQDATVSVATQIFEIDRNDRKAGRAVAAIAPVNMRIAAGQRSTIETAGSIARPKLWGTGPRRKPNRYVAVTALQHEGKTVDVYETPFGIRTLKFDPDVGLFLNGERISLNGVCNHHDLGALGAAVNYRALQRQFEMLAEMGANAIRTSHNPPAPELFLNGKSLGRKKKAKFEYRLRWDDVVYEPGEVRVVAYKDGKRWATTSVRTAGDASKLLLKPDRSTIANDGKDLSFITLTIADKDGQLVPRSMNPIRFEVGGPGEIVAADNGDPTDMTAFPSKDRKAFNGLALAIVRAQRGQTGRIVVTARSAGLQAARTAVTAK